MIPDIRHHFGDREVAKEARVPAGHIVVQHRHVFAHLAILAQGTVELKREGCPTEQLTGPLCLNIPAGVHHGIRAITDVVWFCVHGDPDGEREPDEVKIAPDSHASAMAAMATELGA